MSPGSNKTSDRVSKLTFTGGYNKTLRYGYDAYGNISEINNIWYLYDEASQLTTEVDITTGTGKDYIYDKGGNITEVRHFTNGEYDETDTFTYGDDNWKDLLTEYNGNEITYDEIGNPLRYYNGTEFSWTMGRRLKSALRSDGVKIKYTYNADGLRTSKTIHNVKFNYFWNGDKLTAQTCGDNTWYFRYDGDTPIGFEYNDSQYYYVTDLLGSIIAVLDADGEIAAEYSYDAWGNCTILSDTNTIAYTNPLRYRGYYYDSDTGLYCIQSRYYDSKTGRYINANSANAVLQGELNLFEYDTNPMKYVSQKITDLSGMGSEGKISSCGYFDLKPPRTNNIKKVFHTYVFTMGEFHDESDIIMMNLKKYFKSVYGRVYQTNCADYFHDYWDGIGYADVIVLNTHSSQEVMFNNLYIQDVRKLRKVNCKALIILGCEAGHYKYIWENIAYEFSKKITGLVVASDGYVTSDPPIDEPNFTSVDENREILGWLIYKTEKVNTTMYYTNLMSISIPSILDYLQNTRLVKF